MSNRQRLCALAKTLGVSLQAFLQYPGAVKPRLPNKRLPEQLKHTMLSTACIRRVRSWGRHDRRRGTTELDVQDSADPAGVGQHVARSGGTPAMSIRH